MNKTPTGIVPTDIQEFITDLDGGAVARKLEAVLSMVAAAVMDHERVGQITLKLDVKSLNSGSQAAVTTSLSFKHPTQRGDSSETEKSVTAMHVSPGGKMSFFPDTQEQIPFNTPQAAK